MKTKKHVLKCIAISLLLAGCGEVEESVPRGNWSRTGEVESDAPKKISKTIRKIESYHHVSPVACGKQVFVCTQGGVIAFDSKTAEPIWDISLGADVTKEPVISQGVICTVTRDNDLCVIDVNTGQLCWRDRVSHGTKSPAISGDTLLFGDNKFFYAVDKDSGELKWKHSAVVCTAPTIHRQTVYFCSRNENYEYFICGLDIASGKESFRKQIGSRFLGDFLPIYNGSIFFVAEEELQALDLKTQKTTAIHRVKWLRENLCVSDGTVYFMDRNETGEVYIYAVDVKSRDQLWTQPVSYPSDMIISGKNLYVGVRGSGSPYSGYGGTLLVLDKKTGKQAYTYETDDEGVFPPSFLNGNIYMGDGDNLYILK